MKISLIILLLIASFNLQATAIEPDVATTKSQDQKALKILESCDGESKSCYLQAAQRQGDTVKTRQRYLYRQLSPNVRSHLIHSLYEFEKKEIEQYGSVNYDKLFQEIKKALDPTNSELIEILNYENNGRSEQFKITPEKLYRLANDLQNEYKIWSIINLKCHEELQNNESCSASFKTIPLSSVSYARGGPSSGDNEYQNNNHLNQPGNKDFQSSSCVEVIKSYPDLLNGNKHITQIIEEREKLINCLNWCLNDQSLIEKYPKLCDPQNESEARARGLLLSQLDPEKKFNYRSHLCEGIWAPIGQDPSERLMSTSQICSKLDGTGLEIFETDLIYELGGAATEISNNYLANSPLEDDLVEREFYASSYTYYPSIVRKVALSRIMKANCHFDRRTPSLPEGCKERYGKLETTNFCHGFQEPNYDNLKASAELLTEMFVERRNMHQKFNDSKYDALKLALLNKATIPGSLKKLYDEYHELERNIEFLDNMMFRIATMNPILISDFDKEVKTGAFQEQNLDLLKDGILQKINQSDIYSINAAISYGKKKTRQNLSEAMENICKMSDTELINRPEFTTPALNLFPQFHDAHFCYQNRLDDQDLKKMAVKAGPGLGLLCLPLAFGGPPGMYLSAACGSAYLGYAKMVYDDSATTLAHSQRCFQATGNWEVCESRRLADIRAKYSSDQLDFYLSAALLPLEGIGALGPDVVQAFKRAQALNEDLALEWAVEVSEIRKIKSIEQRRDRAKLLLKDPRFKLLMSDDEVKYVKNAASYKMPNPIKWGAKPEDIVYHQLTVINKASDLGIPLERTGANSVFSNKLHYHNTYDFGYHNSPMIDVYTNEVKIKKFDFDTSPFRINLPEIINNDLVLQKVFKGIPPSKMDEFKKQLDFFIKEGYSLEIDPTCKFAGCGGYFSPLRKVISMPSPPYSYLTWIHEFQHLTLNRYITDEVYTNLKNLIPASGKIDELKEWEQVVDFLTETGFYTERDLARLKAATEAHLPYTGLHELLSTGKELDYILEATKGITKSTDDPGYLTYLYTRSAKSKNNYVTNHARKELLNKTSLNEQEKDLLDLIQKKGRWTNDSEFRRKLLTDSSLYGPNNIAEGLKLQLEKLKKVFPVIAPPLLIDALVSSGNIQIENEFNNKTSDDRIYQVDGGFIKISGEQIFVMSNDNLLPSRIQ